MKRNIDVEQLFELMPDDIFILCKNLNINTNVNSIKKAINGYWKVGVFGPKFIKDICLKCDVINMIGLLTLDESVREIKKVLNELDTYYGGNDVNLCDALWKCVKSDIQEKGIC